VGGLELSHKNRKALGNRIPGRAGKGGSTVDGGALYGFGSLPRDRKEILSLTSGRLGWGGASKGRQRFDGRTAPAGLRARIIEDASIWRGGEGFGICVDLVFGETQLALPPPNCSRRRRSLQAPKRGSGFAWPSPAWARVRDAAVRRIFGAVVQSQRWRKHMNVQPLNKNKEKNRRNRINQDSSHLWRGESVSTKTSCGH